VAYFVLTLVGFYATETEKHKVAVVVFALGAFVELTQAFVPYRTASLADVAANGVGVVGAVVVAFVVDT
jgi:VanZ family protein